MKRFDFSLSLPSFTLTNVTANIEKLQDRGLALKAKGEQLASAMKAEIQNILGGGSADGMQTVLDNRSTIAAPFDRAIKSIEGAIGELVAKKIDPIKVPADGENVNLRQILSDVMSKKLETLAEFDKNVTMSPI